MAFIIIFVVVRTTCEYSRWDYRVK